MRLLYLLIFCFFVFGCDDQSAQNSGRVVPSESSDSKVSILDDPGFQKLVVLRGGDVLEALYEAGVAYEQADPHEQDLELAAEYYTEAAERGHMEACVNLGILYHFGKGVPQDPELEMNWFKKAADLGSVQGMLNVGVMYASGAGVDQDFGEAFLWYSKAADLGDMYAMHNIGFMFEHGEGVEADLDMATEWMRKSAKAGYGPAQEWLSGRGLGW